MIKANNFIPTLNRVLIKRIIQSSTTKSGIILSSKIIDESSRFGKVIAVGKGKISENGVLIPPLVKKGDLVLLPEYGGSKVPIDDKKSEYIICNDTDIPCIIKGYKKEYKI